MKMPNRLQPLKLLAVLAVLILAAGCGTTDLEPAAGADTVPGLDEAASATVDGVRVVVQAAEWMGTAPIGQQVTPLRVQIENDGRHPVRIRYSEWKLVSDEGRRYAALPPFGLEGTVEEPRLVETYPPVVDPTFTGTGFMVAPYYRSLYPRWTAFPGTFPYDPLYYERYHTLWVNMRLPTETMLRHALPEGVVREGGEVAGWLYFENLPADAERVRLMGDLVNPETGEVFGSIEIPFVDEGV